MKRLTIALAVGALVVLAVATAVMAAGPRTQARAQQQTETTLTEILGLTDDQIDNLRRDGMTLAQIAEQQGVDDQKLIDALKLEWSQRIDVRVANGALTDDQATALKEQLELRAKAMVNQATAGGMGGAAVGAGPAGNGHGANPSGANGARGDGAGPTGGGYRGGNAASDTAGRAGNGPSQNAGRGAGNGACDGTGPNGASS
jgi:hypothetical protein